MIEIGLAATPMLYFAVWHLEADGGIQITGSHNPPDYNGFKMMMGKKSFFGADIQKLGEIAARATSKAGRARSRRRTSWPTMPRACCKDVKPGRKLKVAWDTGNGAVGVSIRAVVDKLPGEHFILNEKVDGTFPAHHPDPTVPENLEQLHGRGEAGAAAISASPSTATATASARSTARAASCGATSS